MAVVKKFFQENWLVIFALGVSNLVSFWQFYLKGLLPFPGDLLVSFFFPWNSGGFVGFDSWTTHKEYIASDALRALFPWKVEVIRQFLSGNFPLWNPFNFAGTPLLADFQSGAFFPTNLLYAFLPPLTVWILQVLVLLSLFAFFSYLFLRALKLSPLASAFGAVVLSNLPYLVNWHEILVVTQSALFLPLDLYLLEKFAQTKKTIYLFFLPLFLAFAIFAGHPQTIIMVFFLIGSYALFRRLSLGRIFLIFVISLLLGAVQLLPSWQFYEFSAREAGDTAKLFLDHLFPWRNVITALAPDFFGNPVTGNFWGWDYHNSLAYIGVTALFLALFSFFWQSRRREVGFFALLALIGLLLATSPLANIFLFFKIPILSTGIAARNIFFWQFSLGVLSAFGLDYLLNKVRQSRSRWHFAPLIFLLVLYLLLWVVVLTSSSPEFLISRHNLILPTAIFILTAILILGVIVQPKIGKYLLFVLLALAIFEQGRYFNKIEPFASPAFVFPDHPVLTFLQENAGTNRFIGAGTAKIDSNFATYYRIFDPQGYDPLYLLRYGQLLAASKNGGKKAPVISRADAMIANLDRNDGFKDRLLDILGVKYVLDNENMSVARDWEPGTLETANNRHLLVWQQENKWKIYERQTALPRTFLAGSYEVASSDEAILARLFDPDFAAQDKIILEKDPGFPITNQGSAEAVITHYSPNTVTIQTRSDHPRLLFLSDNYYHGWLATLDGQKAEIFRANYTFRAVAAPSGSHVVEFRYSPESFRLGLVVSVLGLLLWLKFLRPTRS
ncbi:MAG: hypothetical protein UY21_C0001G0070 [Microgenomates group bacterium GW2011_GWA1_48_10]|nr:MAG: hypothetical protein UY21_C0001G0070 [Microgenomates group bacterium GW2011_GWA1_48_10]